MTSTLVISTQADLEEGWRTLMGPDGFYASSLWVMLILDDRPLKQITQIDDLDEPPQEMHICGLARSLSDLRDHLPRQTRVAYLLSRPGSGTVTDLDRQWARAVTDAARRADFRCETVHLATEGEVRPLPLDDLHPGRRAAS